MIPLPPGIFENEKQVMIEIVSYKKDLLLNLRIRPYRARKKKTLSERVAHSEEDDGGNSVGRTNINRQEERRTS